MSRTISHVMMTACVLKKNLRPRKKWNMSKKIKNLAPGIGGAGRFAAIYKNDVISGNVVYYSEEDKFFGIFFSEKFVKKCPRDVKTVLGISDDGRGCMEKRRAYFCRAITLSFL